MSFHPDRTLTRVCCFTLAYVVVAAAVAIWRGNAEFVFYIGVMVVLAGVIYAVHRRVSLSPGVLWCLSVWGLLHMAGGLVPVPESAPIGGPVRVLYSLWLVPNVLKYDQLVHAYGFGVATWMCWQALSAGFGKTQGRAPEPTLGLLTLSALAGMGLGAFNEVVEFAATLLMESTNVGGYVNTGWDLVFNLLGCILAAVMIRRNATKSGN